MRQLKQGFSPFHFITLFVLFFDGFHFNYGHFYVPMVGFLSGFLSFTFAILL